MDVQTAPPGSAQPRIASLRRQIQALSESDREVLWMLSLICQPIDAARLILCLDTVGWGKKGGAPPEPSKLKGCLTRLKRKKLVVEWQHALRCRPEVLELATRDAVRTGRFEDFARAVKRTLPVVRLWNSNWSFENYDQALREIRIALYRGRARDLNEALQNAHRSFPLELSRRPPLYTICTHPFEADWFSGLPREMRAAAAYTILPVAGRLLQAQPELVACLGRMNDALHSLVRLFLADYHMLRGEFASARELCRGLSGPAWQLRLARLAFLEGDLEDAVGLFREALAGLRAETRKSKAYFQTVGGLFFIFSLLEAGTEGSCREALQYAEIGRRDSLWRESYSRLLVVVRSAQGDYPSEDWKGGMSAEEGGDPESANPGLEVFFRHLFDFWIDPRSVANEGPGLLRLYQRALEQGFRWVAAETAELLAEIGNTADDWGARARELRPESAPRSLVGCIRILEPWRRTLRVLREVGAGGGSGERADTYRLAWQLTWQEEAGMLDPRPVEQRLNSRGKWTRGRTVSLRRLWRADERPDFLTEQDRRVCDAIEMEGGGWQGMGEQTAFEFNAERAIADLVGHPCLFLEGAPKTSVELLQGRPRLLIEDRGERLHVRLVPRFPAGRTLMVEREGPTRFRVTRKTVEHLRIGEVLGAGLDVPRAGTELLKETIEHLSAFVIVQSDIASGRPESETRAGEPIPHIHLLPSGDGMEVEILVRPLGESGPTCLPGKGGSTVIAEIDGVRIEARRDLEDEETRVAQVVSLCSVLKETPGFNYTWELETPEECLELLLQLQGLDGKAIVAWPEEHPYTVVKEISFDDLSLQITKKRDWFSVSGEVSVNEDLALSLSEMIRLMPQGTGRFIRLAEGQFVALTESFRKRLEDLAAIGDLRNKGSVLLNPLAAGAVEGLVEEAAEAEVDDAWVTQLQRMAGALDHTPEVPSTLLAELRDYQYEGFVWLARLACWRAGGCLADDMGLGKTVQALAMILTRATKGPTLVVAPTSVCLNWAAETARFTPTLRVRLFGVGDRGEMLRTLEPLDLVICSYGLMQSAIADLASVYWETIVLDEAQAIKNPRAKRSLAALRLQGGFRIVTTGTPIENHLSELWSLFRFLNPGLLGTREAFMERFAIPIERNGDPVVRHRLRRMVHPFILRRTKSQVLDELPARIEILQHVELGEKERAFYEALRRESIRALHEKEGPASGRRFQILAEITKLRQACCNPRLILADTKIPSAKLDMFDEMLDELVESNHKALVFSQFVRHLKILREHLDAKGITYQYLDGTTPPRDRAAAVAAFQGGEGDLFLISLRAGGTGLNLTAADYVIHMDPWWNPAVEDQASDRAHRIGQHRPVTIYRFVAKDTIEDKIVELHQHKRDLADSLLEGTHVPASITAEELLRLLAE